MAEDCVRPEDFRAEIEESIRRFQLARAHELFLKHESEAEPLLYRARRKDRIARRWQSIRYDLRQNDFENARTLLVESLDVVLEHERADSRLKCLSTSSGRSLSCL